MFSNLIDLTLVEYSTSKLKTHIKRERLVLWDIQNVFRRSYIGYVYCSGFGKNNTEQNCSLNCLQIPPESGPRLPGTLDGSWPVAAGQALPAVWLAVTMEGESVVPSPASVTIYKSGSSHLEPLWYKNFRLFQLLPIPNLGCFGSQIPTLPTPIAAGSFREENKGWSSRVAQGLKPQGQSSSI